MDSAEIPKTQDTGDRNVVVASYLLAATALAFVLHFHLVPAVLAGFLTHALLSRSARWLRGPRLSHGAAKWLAAGLMALAAASVVTGLALLLHAFWRGHVGNLPDLFRKMAEALEATRAAMERRGLENLLPGLDTSIPIEERVTTWLKDHSAQLSHAGVEGGKLVLHALLGVVLGLLTFFAPGSPSDRPLARALRARVERFADAFESVLFAQVEISAINTSLTAVYLLVLLPLLHVPLPFRGTLVALTFVVGLVPIAGNLISNSVIVVVSLGVGPWVALGSLLFLVAVHKLEYFVNAKIVGGRIGAAAWEILLAIVVCEVSFGAVGVVVAPIVYAWIRKELSDQELV